MDNVKKLFADLETNEALRAKLDACKDDVDAANAALSEAGYSVTIQDIKAFAENQSVELSDEDLDNVAGGVASLNAVEGDIVSNLFKVVENLIHTVGL